MMSGKAIEASLEHFSVLILLGICFDILDEQEAEVGGYDTIEAEYIATSMAT